MNKYLFSIICVCIIIMLLYVNFNNTEKFYAGDTDTYKSIKSSNGVYINIKVLPNETIEYTGTGTDGLENITGFYIEIPVDNKGGVLGISDSSRLGILQQDDPKSKWGVLEINKNNYNTLMALLNNVPNHTGVMTNIGNVIPVNENMPPDELKTLAPFYIIYEPDSSWTTRKTNYTDIERNLLTLDNNGNLSVGGMTDRVGWTMSYESVNPMKIVQDQMTHVGPLPYLESDPNSISIKLNIDDDKLKNILGGDGYVSNEGTTPQKCETWLSKDSVASICPGCVVP
jgi:hypothetical protein